MVVFMNDDVLVYGECVKVKILLDWVVVGKL